MPGSNREFLQTFFDYLKYEKRYSEHTLVSYRTDLTDFFDYLEGQYGKMPLADIAFPFIRSWLASLKDAGMTSKSIKRKISALRSFFKYHLRTGSIDSTPMGAVISPKVSKRLPVFLREEDARSMVEGMGAAGGDWKTLNGRMLVTIFYATGMRLSELINLREQQVDFSRAQVRVLGKGNKERVIPVSQELLAAIREYRDNKRREFGDTGDYLLVTEKGKKLYPKYAWTLVNRILGATAPLDRNSPHVLRHSFATHLMNNGADLNAVKELLGHSSLASTQVYTHNTIGKLKDIHKKAHPKA
jgi:integrase/recombinase XerC